MEPAIGMHAGPDAVVVAVSDGPGSPAVVGRWSLRLLDHRNHPELVQPYHAAAEVLGIEAGRERIKLCEDAARLAASEIVDQIMTEVGGAIGTPSSAGLVLGAGRVAGSLEEILRSHVQLHTAEGELLRAALRHAADSHGLRVVGLPERELVPRLAALTQLPEADIIRRVAETGKALGPPWTKRQKHAFLAAWAALEETRPGR